MPIDLTNPVVTPSLEAMLWDMDGTLVDTEPIWVQCEEELMAEFGYQWSEDDASHCIGGPMERVQLYLKEKSRSDYDPRWFGNRLVEMMLERLEDGAVLRPGALELIEAARDSGVRLALVSASRRPIVDAVLKGLPFGFDLSISADDVEISKPNPEGYVRAAGRLASTIHSCVVIEDSAVGIRSGLDSGAMVIGVTPDSFDHDNFLRVAELSEISFSRLRMVHKEWVDRVLINGDK
jgi:HAD superfamily hydrolase (TIGR01509 family)